MNTPKILTTLLKGTITVSFCVSAITGILPSVAKADVLKIDKPVEINTTSNSLTLKNPDNDGPGGVMFRQNPDGDADFFCNAARGANCTTHIYNGPGNLTAEISGDEARIFVPLTVSTQKVCRVSHPYSGQAEQLVVPSDWRPLDCGRYGYSLGFRPTKFQLICLFSSEEFSQTSSFGSPAIFGRDFATAPQDQNCGW